MFDRWSVFTSELAEASRIIKANPGKLRSVHVTNTGGADLYLQVFNAAALPADTAVAQKSTLVPAGGDAQLDFGEDGQFFSSGIAMCLSTTQATKTLAGAVGLFDVRWI